MVTFFEVRALAVSCWAVPRKSTPFANAERLSKLDPTNEGWLEDFRITVSNVNRLRGKLNS